MERNHPLDDIGIFLSTLNNKQLIHSNKLNIQENKKFLEAVIELFENQNSKNNYNLFPFYNNLGAIYEEEKQYNKALDLLAHYPSSPYKSSLELMVNYVIERKK